MARLDLGSPYPGSRRPPRARRLALTNGGCFFAIEISEIWNAVIRVLSIKGHGNAVEFRIEVFNYPRLIDERIRLSSTVKTVRRSVMIST